MSTFTIPNNRGEIRQVNSGDLFGELSETFNIDLTSSQGKIKTSKRLFPALKQGVDIGTPAGFCDILVWGGNYYILTEDEVYRCLVASNPTVASNWSEVTAIGDLDIGSTAVIFDGQMMISLGTDVGRYNGTIYVEDWWTNEISGTALTAGSPPLPHVMEVLRTAQETIFITDGNVVRYYNTTSGHDSFTLQTDLTACCLAASLSGSMWCGTYTETGNRAMVYELQQGETIATNAYPINARAVLAIWTKDNIPYIVTDRGEIQAFNGAGFTTIAEFPFKYSGKAINGVRSGLIQNSNRSRPIHPRAVDVYNDSVFFNISTKAALTDDEYPTDTRSHSGVWEYNYKTQVLNHRFSFAHQDEDFGDMVQIFSYPLLIVDNDFTFIIAGGYDGVNITDNIYMTSENVSQAWFITPEITSGTITDAYESIYHKAKTLGINEEIVTQYRTSKRDTIKSTLNWINETTCTTTDDWSLVEVGDLIRVVSRKSAGNYANIVSITPSVSTYTIKIDKPIGESGTTSNVYCDNFKKDPGKYLKEHGEVRKQGGYGANPWIQFAVFLKGEIEYRQFISEGKSKNER